MNKSINSVPLLLLLPPVFLLTTALPYVDEPWLSQMDIEVDLLLVKFN